MKLAKTVAILIALVMVVVCFNAPAVFSGSEHPWDQEGSGGGGRTTGGGFNPDTVKTGGSPTTSYGPGVSNNKFTGSMTTYERLMVTLNFVVWYRDIPAFSRIQSRSIDREARITTTHIGTK